MKRSSLAALIVGVLIPVLSGTGCRLPQKTEKAEKEIVKAAPLSPTEETKEETLSELVKAAEAGNPSAQCNLGVAFAEGQGVSQDYKEAAKWYAKAAEQGLAEAQFGLGALYADGLGVSQDYVQALMWFNLAAAGGDQDAPKARDDIAQRMTREQIAQAKELAAKWKPSKAEIPRGVKSDAVLSTRSLPKDGEAIPERSVDLFLKERAKPAKNFKDE